MPLKHNDGRPVEDVKFFQTREDLVAQFGAVSFSPSSVLGIWIHEGRRFEDELVRLTIDVEDTAENHLFFSRFKTALLVRFEQIEIYIASYPIDLL